MSLCRRIQCAVCDAIRRSWALACAGALGLPLLASGCGGVMHLAGADLLSVADENGEFGPSGDSAREGSSRSRPTPSLAAAQNADDPADAGPLAALSAIEVSGDSGEARAEPASAEATRTEPARDVAVHKPTRRPRRPERIEPTGPVSIFADEPQPIAARRAHRSHVALATAQEEVPAKQTPHDDGDGAAPAEMMTVEQIVNVAVREHPLLRQRQEEIRLAEADLVGAGLLPNPQLVMDTDTPTQEAGPTELSYRLTFTIPLGGRIGLAQQVADLGIRRAQLLASYETEIIVNEAVAAALEVLYWQELVVLQADQVALANELVAKALPPAVPESDQLSARVNAKSLELQRLDSVRELRAARMRLSKAIGFNPPRAIRVNGVLTDNPAPEVQLETLLAAVRENRPEIAEGHLSIAQGRRQMALAMAEAIPDLELGPRFQDDFRSPTDSMGARISTDVPLFDRNQGGLAESDATVRVNRATLGVTEMTTLSDVAEAFAQIAPLQSRLTYYRKELPELIQNAEAALRALSDVGKLDINKISSEQQRLIRLRIEHLKLKYQYNRLRALVELYAGRSLEQLAEAEARSTREPRPHDENPFQDEPAAAPEAKPAEPRARKDDHSVDSRVAASRSRSAVVPAAAVESEKPQGASLLNYVKRLGQRKSPSDSNSLPYGNAKASATTSR